MLYVILQVIKGIDNPYIAEDIIVPKSEDLIIFSPIEVVDYLEHVVANLLRSLDEATINYTLNVSTEHIIVKYHDDKHGDMQCIYYIKGVTEPDNIFKYTDENEIYSQIVRNIHCV